MLRRINEEHSEINQTTVRKKERKRWKERSKFNPSLEINKPIEKKEINKSYEERNKQVIRRNK